MFIFIISQYFIDLSLKNVFLPFKLLLMSKGWKGMKIYYQKSHADRLWNVAWDFVHLIRGHFVTYLHSLVMNLYWCLANTSLIAVLLIHISVIKYVLIRTVSRDTSDGVALNHFALPFSLFALILHSCLRFDSAAFIWHFCKRLWCFWQMLIEEALKAWLHCNQKKITRFNKMSGKCFTEKDRQVWTGFCRSWLGVTFD